MVLHHYVEDSAQPHAPSPTTLAQQNRYLRVCGYEALGNMSKTPESSTLEPRMG